jgi:uncharacterized protein (TIGR02265 family)
VASITNQSMFEALFERRLKPTGAFREALVSAGYDGANAKPKYPTEVWTRCLGVARAHRYAELSEQEAWRQIGREFTLGFLETLVGRLVAVAIPLMSPDSFLNRLATWFRMGREDEGLTFDVVERGVGVARIVVHNPAAVGGGFVAGMIEIGFERLERAHSVEVLQSSPVDYELRVRWQ